MKKIAIIISTPPHGTAFGREALDATLALSAYNHVSLFFIGDGVFHLLDNQQPNQILMRDYIVTFGILELYDIDSCYASAYDLAYRHITDPIIDVKPLETAQLQKQLSLQDSILRF